MVMRNRPTFAFALATTLVLAACGTAGSPSPQSSVSASASIPAQTASPAPLPGGRLVYAFDIPGGVSVFTANTDGTGAHALLSSPTVQLPRWAPDGGRISVVAESPQGLIFVGLVNPDGSDYLRFDSRDPSMQLGCVAWSPDGSRLACEGWDDTDPTRNGIYTVRASDGGDLTRVTSSPDGAHDIPGDYSPDGRQIVFVAQTLDEEQSTLTVVNVDGSNRHALIDRKVGQAPRWTPDGRSILTDASGSLLLVPVDGGEPSPIKLDTDLAGIAQHGAWSPDGEWIVFAARFTAAGWDIYIMRKDGTDLHQVTDTPGQEEDFGADWVN